MGGGSNRVIFFHRIFLKVQFKTLSLDMQQAGHIKLHYVHTKNRTQIHFNDLRGFALCFEKLHVQDTRARAVCCVIMSWQRNFVSNN